MIRFTIFEDRLSCLRINDESDTLGVELFEIALGTPDTPTRRLFVDLGDALMDLAHGDQDETEDFDFVEEEA